MQIDLKKWVIPVTVGVTSFAAGGGLGYFLAHRKFKKLDLLEEDSLDEVQLQFMFDDIEQRMTHQLLQVQHVIKEFKERGDEFLTANTTTIFDEAKSNHPSYTGQTLVLAPEPSEEDDNMVNVFRVDEDDGWDYEVELPKRGPEHPYIIHRDEYDSDEMDYRHSSLTYYAGDNILCDEYDTPIYNPDKIVGELRFGYGSGDPSICYVRNEDLEAEYEVIIDHGYFQQEVLGQQVEEKGLSHSRGVPKFRMD